MNFQTMKILLTFALILTWLSCKKNEPAPEYHYDYFPIETGRYVIYDVQEMVHDDTLHLHDTIHYQLKTLIGDVFVDNAGRSAYEFLRFKRSDETQQWQTSDLWTVILDNNRLEIVEENQRIIRLVFAVSASKSWNPNAFNNLDEAEFYYEDLHKSKQIGNQTFDETVIVEQEDFFSLIDHRRKFEVYAKNVGLVQRYYKDLRINNFDTTDVVKGTEQYFTVKSFGIE